MWVNVNNSCPLVSKPDRGIVKNRLELSNQDGLLLVSYFDTILMARRPEAKITKSN